METVAVRVEGLRYLLFGSHRRRFAVDLEQVEEIVAPLAVVPVPLAPQAVEGIANLRGRVLTVLSLRRLLGLAGEDLPAAALVVLRVPETALAFAVEELQGIIRISTGVLGEMNLADEGAPFTSAVFQHGGGPVSLIDAGRMLAFLEGAAVPGTATL